jgi:hypothetical protein
MQPKFVTIEGWFLLSNMCRSRTYVLIKSGALRAVKEGRRTLIDVDQGLEYMRSLPQADSGSAPSRVAA